MADEKLQGTVERVVFRNDDSAFTVARFKTTQNQLVTVVGELVDVSEGMPLTLTGKWVNDKKWGPQFQFAESSWRAPNSKQGIAAYLSSREIKGVGPELAKRIVDKLGTETLAIIKEQPARLTEIPGIGTQRAKAIADAVAAKQHVEDVMVFLHGAGVSANFAVRIVKEYGNDAIARVRKNPYQLARDVRGIGFHKADAIAGNLGIARDAPERIEAGLLHALEASNDDGHMHIPDDELLAAAAELLQVGAELLPPRLAALEASHLVVRETLGQRGPCTSLPWVHTWEVEGAQLLARLVETPAKPLAIDADAAIHKFEHEAGVTLAAQQRHAVTTGLVDKCTVITGGPGVGKTTIIKAIVSLAGRRKVALAAPTGRAAKRLGEATARAATTIHRLLEFNPRAGGFTRNAEEPLDEDIVIVDEASMLDAQLFRALLGALRPAAQLVLVGDIDQLPSVGPGAVLGDVIDSGAANVIRLTEIFRQAAASKIVVSAHAINSGHVPDLEPPGGTTSDFYFIGRDDPQAARATIVELVAERIPQRFGFDARTEIQVLAPMHRGDLGTAALNRALQDRLTPPADGIELQRGDRAFRRGDKVMQLRNDYDKEVFNGDIGVIADITKDTLTMQLDDRTISYERSELDQLVHAYAVSIHKSQGSEYPVVVISLATQHAIMLQRTLLYTAVTRGKRLVVIVGSKRAVALAVRNAEAKRRYTWLAERVREALQS